MDKKEGLRNYCVNIKSTMIKIRDKEKLSSDELNQILEFYKEVMCFLSE